MLYIATLKTSRSPKLSCSVTTDKSTWTRRVSLKVPVELVWLCVCEYPSVLTVVWRGGEWWMWASCKEVLEFLISEEFSSDKMIRSFSLSFKKEFFRILYLFRLLIGSQFSLWRNISTVRSEDGIDLFNLLGNNDGICFSFLGSSELLLSSNLPIK